MSPDLRAPAPVKGASAPETTSPGKVDPGKVDPGKVDSAKVDSTKAPSLEATGPEVVPVERRPGRPRSVEADAAILDAALEALAEEGYGRLTMEGVAARAGVGKATLYRRWSSKPELILDAVRSMKSVVPHPDSGDIRADLIELVRTVVAHGRAERNTRVTAALLAEVQRDSELAELFRERLLAPRRLETEAVLRRAIERGDLPPDTDCTLVLDQLMGSVFYRSVVVGEPLRPRDVEALVDQVLEGIVTR